MFKHLFRARKSPTSSFRYIFKEAQRELFEGAGPGLFTAAQGPRIDDVHERQRLAAFKAWETRRRAAPKQPAAEKVKAPVADKLTLPPTIARRDQEVEKIASDVIPNLSYSKWQAIGGGVNDSGKIKTPDGKEMFLKFSSDEENSGEVGAWGVAKAIGWGDITMPTYATKLNKREAIVRDMLPDGTTWRRAATNLKAKALADKERVGRIALYEYVVADTDDRHHNNYWVDDTGKLWSIDQARGFQNEVRLPDYRNVFRHEEYLRHVPVENLKAVVAAKNDIIAVAKKVTPYHGWGRENEDHGDKAAKERLAVIEQAYNDAVANKKKTVNLNYYIEKGEIARGR